MNNTESIARDYFIKNRDLFSDVQDVNSKMNGSISSGEHSILNYELIISEMTKYLEGYQRYKRDGNDKYKHDVLTSTYQYFDKMFDPNSKKYRKKMSLSKFSDMNKNFVIKTKEFINVINTMKKSVDNETLSLARISENQFKKLSKVHSDDMKLYMWLVANASIPSDLRVNYNDTHTPVMHKLKKEG